MSCCRSDLSSSADIRLYKYCKQWLKPWILGSIDLTKTLKLIKLDYTKIIKIDKNSKCSYSFANAGSTCQIPLHPQSGPPSSSDSQQESEQKFPKCWIVPLVIVLLHFIPANYLNSWIMWLKTRWQTSVLTKTSDRVLNDTTACFLHAVAVGEQRLTGQESINAVWVWCLCVYKS